jgi:hypothetical protein
MPVGMMKTEYREESMRHNEEDGYVLCGIVGRMGMCCVALWGGQVCVVWHWGEGGFVLCGIVGRTGMCSVALWGGRVCIVWHSGEDGYV